MDEPLVQPSGQPAHVNPQLDGSITTPKQKRALDDNFSSFFADLDAKAAATPEVEPEPEPQTAEPVKAEAPVNETKSGSPLPEQPAQAEQKESPKDPVPSATAPAPVPHPLTPAAVPTDIDALELHSNASEEQKGQFSKLKAIAKAFSAKAKAYEKLGPLLKDLGYTVEDTPEDIAKAIEDFGPKVKTWKTTALSPEVTKELESLRGLARAVDYKQSKEYQGTYLAPMQEAYVDVLSEATKYFDAPPEKVAEFLDTMKTKYKPQDLDSKWWSTDVIGSMKKADDATRQKVLSKVADLLKLQEKHDRAVDKYSSSPDSYAQWQQAQTANYGQDYAYQIRDEVEKALAADKQHLKPWLPLPTEGVHDPDKLSEIKAHNAHFADLERKFSGVISEFNAGPRRAARYALDFIEMQERVPELEKQNSEKDTHIKSLEAEVLKLRTEVTAKRKVSDAPLRSGAGTGAKPTPDKAKLTEASGMKGLMRAFEKDLPKG